MQTWQESQAETYEVMAENVEHAILNLRRVESLFDTPSEREVISACIDKLSTKNLNLLSQADKLRKEVHVVGERESNGGSRDASAEEERHQVRQ